MMDKVTEAELSLLKWLGQEDFSQYGECYGTTLDGLLSKGLAQVHGQHEHQNGFISSGDTIMYRAVSLTDKGRAALSKEKG